MANIGIASGKTAPGQGWQPYANGKGIFIDVDTSSFDFTTTPVYVTALHGRTSHYDTVGASSVYSPTPTGFRIYIRRRDGAALQPAFAQQRDWHIQWIAIEG